MIPNPDNAGLSYRLINFIGLVLCAGTLAFAVLYMQGELGLQPCPLCTLTRVILLIMAAIFLIGWLLNPRAWLQRLFAGFNLLLATGGIAASIRQVWLRTTQDLPACAQLDDAMLNGGPGMPSLADTFRGIGECADNGWQVLGIDWPYLTLALFVILFVLLWRQLRKRARRSYFS
ncbi:disulfide bond formation protein B [Marinobacterium nitratireducens]|uniref:Disulfide bond formation protein B n=1 Tax=Marinobacterium nitratireducens TaxID=518897 RepID=A0A917ZJQ1_9GAMM|nr:disulfide bond formation protein B [Marinobacterium nitratireducens]GGO83244.1 disulfide bond formation protein B [Marinobacterium nitratireducens]